MAKPGYGKRSAPDQRPRTRDDFTLLPTRERYVAGFVDHLPDGAAMSVKQLAKQLPLYGQQAISTALTALSVAGHLRRVRCPVVGAGGEARWVFRTFWSRTARDNEWWNTYLATEQAAQTAAPAPSSSARDMAPPPSWAPAEEEPPLPPEPERPARNRPPNPPPYRSNAPQTGHRTPNPHRPPPPPLPLPRRPTPPEPAPPTSPSPASAAKTTASPSPPTTAPPSNPWQPNGSPGA